MLAQLDAFIGGLTQHFHAQWLGFGRVVVLILRKGLVLAVLLTRQLRIVALHVGIVGGGDEPVVLRVVEPAITGDAVEPAGEFVGLVIEGHREALPGLVEQLGW